MLFWSRLWAGWKRVAHQIGNVQSRLLLMVFYFVVVAPVALVFRLTKDPLKRKAPPDWESRPPRPPTLDFLRQQF